MSHTDLQSLLGAYALDALDPEEMAAVEEHLAECPRCQSEVAAHLNTASLLVTPGEEAPPPVWDRIAAELGFDDAGFDGAGSDDGRAAGDFRPPPRLMPAAGAASRPAAPPERDATPAEGAPPAHVVPLRRRRGFALPAVAALATVAAAAAVTVGVTAASLNHRVNDLSTALHSSGLQQAAAAAVLAPKNQEVQLTSATSSAPTARVVVLPNGNAYLVSSSLPALDSQRTYQLWGLAAGKAVSLGLLGSDPQVVAFRVEPGVTRLMVTAEPRGGVPQPTTPVLAQGNLV